MFQKKIAVLVEKILKQSRAQNLFLEEAKSGETRDHASFKASYVKCGAPFFKDALCVPAPFNDDYKFRKSEGKEYFPFDIPSTSSRWKTEDKVALVNGVKNQMVNHIKSQQSQKMCQNMRKTRGKLQKLKFMSKNTDFNDSSMLEIFETIQKVYPDFKINWNIVSFSDLNSTHSVSECMGMWFSYLQPTINREPFSDEENSVMSAVFAENDFQDWGYIASMLHNRSSLQTFVHFNTIYSRLCANNVRWSEKEDADLLKLIDRHSINNVVNWGRIGQLMPLRNRVQCYNRYQILSRIKGYQKGRFTNSENRLIMEFVDKYGEENFKKMPKNFLPGRSINQIKNQYSITLKQRGDIKPWTREEDRLLMDHVEKQKQVDWRAIADVLETHNRVSCRTRYQTIAKFLQKNPGKTLEDVPTKYKRATVVPRIIAEEQCDEVDKKMLPTASNSAASFKKFREQNGNLVEMLSTAFNLDFNRHEVTVEPQLMLTILVLLGYELVQKTIDRRTYFFTGEQLLELREVARNQLTEKALNEIKFVMQHTDFRMPPSINTVLGHRAVIIKKHTEEDSAFAITHPSEKYTSALKAFQELYFKLFYWPAMLQKIESEELNRTHFAKCRQALNSHHIFNALNTRSSPYLQRQERTLLAAKSKRAASTAGEDFFAKKRRKFS